MYKKISFLFGIIVFTTLLTTNALGIFYPKSYIEERVTSEYNWTGEYISEDRKGSVKILSKDILQDVKMELSNTDGTNLLSTTAYRPAIASPGSDPVKLYLNTSESDKALNYNIDPLKTPKIEVNVEYNNKDGGKNLHEGENTFEFRITLESTTDIQNGEFIFQVPMDTGYNDEDSFDLGKQACTNYNVCRRLDKDNDGYYERIKWEGNFPSGEEIVIVFEGDTTSDVNFKEEQMKIKMNNGEYRAVGENPNTFTGMTFISRGAKDSVRNGVYLTQISNKKWYIRGFLKNKADNLRYKINGWQLYRVGNETPLSSSSKERYVDPEETIFTGSYPTNDTKKKYFMSSFDWWVVWGDSYYTGKVTSNINMPTLYLTTLWLDKTLTLEKNDKSGRRLLVKDVVRNLGSEELEINKTEIYSTIPHLSHDGTVTKWKIQNVSVLFRNSTNTYNITKEVNITKRDATEDKDGYVYADINIENSSTVSSYDQNEDFIVKYKVTSDDHDNDKTYTFDLNSTAKTKSQTPTSDSISETITIPGTKIVKEEKPSGGGGAVMPKKVLELEPEKSTSSIITGNLVKVEREDRIIDTGDRGVRELNPRIFIPKKGTLEPNSLDIEIYRKNEWGKIPRSNYTINDKGLKEIGEEMYHFYDIKIKSERLEGLTLHNNDKIRISYKARVNFGKNEIITRWFGYNYYEDRYFSNDAPTVVRVGWEIQPLNIQKKRWVQTEAIVGEPVKWERKIWLKNPNNASVTKTYNVHLPRGAFSSEIENENLEVKEIDGEQYVEWEVKAKPLMERWFVANAYTSPVLLTEEDIRILKSKETWVKFLLNNTFKSFGSTEYRNVYKKLPIPVEKVQSVKMGKEELNYTGIGNSTKISLGSFEPNEEKSISIIYKEMPPILEITPDSFNYTQSNIANISVLVVGKKDQKTGYVELEVRGPQPEQNEVYSEIFSLRRERTGEFLRSLDLTNLPEGNYTVRGVFRKNFANIITDETSFWVTKKGGYLEIEDWYLLILLGIIIIGIVSRIYRKKEKYRKEMKKLRKKIDETFK